jgi:hypothetical protein
MKKNQSKRKRERHTVNPDTRDGDSEIESAERKV